MKFFMTLGLAMVLVGYAMAGVSLMVSEHFRPIPPKEDLEEDYYGETITEKKPFHHASDLTYAGSVHKTESFKRYALESTGEDRKSNVHQHDEETHGGSVRVARGVGRNGEYGRLEPTPPSHLAAAISGLFKSSGSQRDDKDEY